MTAIIHLSKSPVRSKQGQLTRKLAAFSAQGLKGEIEPKKAELQERIEALRKELDELKGQRKAIKHHITMAELPEEERFNHQANAPPTLDHGGEALGCDGER